MQKPNDDIQRSTEAQKTKAETTHKGFGLDPTRGNEQSRTGKTTVRRNIEPGPRPEADDTRSQNASGGKSNR